MKRTYKPIPIPSDYSAPDVTIGMAMFYLGLSASTVQRLAALGEITSFKYGESRRIVFESLKAYRQRAIDAGPRFAERPVTGKRRAGRPSRSESPPPSIEVPARPARKPRLGKPAAVAPAE
jgi:excisionase family DNA binding protein